MAVNVLLVFIGLYLLTTEANASGGFIDHGPVVPLASLRGAVAVRSAKGENLVIACSMDTSPQGWILVTNIDTGASRQVWIPKQYPNSPPYGSILGSNGKFYTCEGPTFLEFDPDVGDWTFHSKTEDGCFIGATEGPDGTIYFGGCPGCHLIAFNPKTRELTDYGPMDPKEQYLNDLATDSSGWVYCGIGTARENLVAFNPRTKERRQLIKEEDRKTGTAAVIPGADGKAYATVRDQHFRLFEGNATPIAADAVAPRAAVHNINWGQTISDFPDGRSISEYNMLEKYLTVTGPQTGQTKRIPIDYQSDGSRMTLITAGPGGKVYGGSSFPACIVSYDPKEGGPIRRLGNHYWHSFAVSGTKMAAGQYAGGYLYIYDTAKPWTTGPDERRSNPQCVAQYKRDMNTPVATLFYPDGRHVVAAGYPDYGYRGGGIAVYDMETGQSELLTHKDLVPEHSIVSMRVLRDGNIIAGTSNHGGQGTQPAPGDARLIILDWKTKKVAFQQVPVRGAGTIIALERDAHGLVYGLTDTSSLFVFDPVTHRVRRRSLAEYGNVARNPLAIGPDGSLYALFSKALVRIKPGGTQAEKLADAPAPITNGIAIVDRRVYFICTSRLWSFGLEIE